MPSPSSASVVGSGTPFAAVYLRVRHGSRLSIRRPFDKHGLNVALEILINNNNNGAARHPPIQPWISIAWGRS